MTECARERKMCVQVEVTAILPKAFLTTNYACCTHTVTGIAFQIVLHECSMVAFRMNSARLSFAGVGEWQKYLARAMEPVVNAIETRATETRHRIR